MKYLFIILIAFSFIGCDGEGPTRIVYAEFTVISNPSGVYTMNAWFGGGMQTHTEGPLGVIPVGFTLTTSEYSWVKGYNCTASTSSGGSTIESGEDVELEIKLFVDGDLKETEIVNGFFQATNFIIP